MNETENPSKAPSKVAGELITGGKFLFSVWFGGVLIAVGVFMARESINLSDELSSLGFLVLGISFTGLGFVIVASTVVVWLDQRIEETKEYLGQEIANATRNLPQQEQEN